MELFKILLKLLLCFWQHTYGYDFIFSHLNYKNKNLAPSYFQAIFTEAKLNSEFESIYLQIILSAPLFEIAVHVEQQFC